MITQKEGISMRTLLSVVAGCMLLLCTGNLLSQEIIEEREKVKERINMIRMWKMMEVLDLSREQSEQLFPVLERIEEKRRELFQDRGRTIRELRNTVKGENPDEDALRELMGRLEKNHEDLEGLYKEERSAVGKVLDIAQQARYLIFKENFERELRSIIRDVKERPFEKPRYEIQRDERARERF